MPITPKTGSLFHAETAQAGKAAICCRRPAAEAAARVETEGA
jgi:hypothetical protein